MTRNDIPTYKCNLCGEEIWLQHRKESRCFRVIGNKIQSATIEAADVHICMTCVDAIQNEQE